LKSMGRLFLAGFLVCLLAACSKEVPSAPRHDNPLDLRNPQTGGDPFQVRVESTPDGPRLSWSQVDVPGMEGYLVYRRVADEEEYELLQSVGKGMTVLVDTSIAPGYQYTYSVVVRGVNEWQSDTTALVPATWGAAPMVSIEGGSPGYVTQYDVTLSVQASGATRMQVGHEPSFSGLDWETYQRSRSWKLQGGFGERRVYVRVIYTTGDTSEVGEVVVVVHRLPVADAGEDQEVAWGTEVRLNGSGSRDPDGNALTYHWSSLSGVELSDTSASSPTFVASVPGEYRFTLVVNDGQEDSVADEVMVVAAREYEHEQVLVPAGEFIMGSDSGESREQPVHAVYLDAFFIDKYEVTNAQWNEYTQATGKSTKSGSDDHPVVSVTWFNARDYCAWAGMRLPTEAEWEKAARGTNGCTYPWGEGIDSSKVKYWDSGDDYDNGMTSVGMFPEGVSPYGAHDMAGNINEWVADWYDNGYYASSPSSNPQGPTDGSYRVFRGGWWQSDPFSLRTSWRNARDPSLSYDYIGFRCAQD